MIPGEKNGRIRSVTLMMRSLAWEFCIINDAGFPCNCTMGDTSKEMDCDDGLAGEGENARG